MAADPSHPSTSSNSAAVDEPKLPDSFPVGLRVLAVDDDPTCLRIIDRMLRRCNYTVTTCCRAADAMDLLRENRGSFDMVLSDVHMPDMDGFKILEFAGLEMDLPVIMMSADESKDVVFKGVKHGACDYLIKPVRMENLKNIWQHVVRKNLKDLENSGSAEDGVEKQKKERSDDVDNDSLGNEGNWKNGKRRREGEEEEEFEEREDSSTLKKPRVVWSQELHDQFVTAVKALGIDKAVPKKILEQMNVAGLTRENVASHLQKYRIYLKRVSQQPPGRVDSSLSSITDPSFEQYDLPAFPSSGQLPSQALINLQSMPRRGTNLGMDVTPMSDQTYYLNPDAQLANSSRMHPTVVQQVNNTMIIGNNACMQQRMFSHPQKIVQSYSNMGLHVNEGTQGLFNLPQSSIRTSPTYSIGNINGHVSDSVVMQMNQHRQQISLAQQQEQIQFAAQRQAQARGHLVNGINIEHDSGVSTTVGQQILSNGLQALNLVKNAAAVSPLHEPYMNFSQYGSVPEAFYAPHINSKMPSTRASTGFVQETTTTSPNIVHNVAVLRGDSDTLPNIDIVEDWNFPNINVQQDTKQHGSEQDNIVDFGSGVSPRQNFSTNLKDGSNLNSCNMRKDIYSTAAKIGHEISEYYSEELLSGAHDVFSNSDELILRKQEVAQTNCQYDV